MSTIKDLFEGMLHVKQDFKEDWKENTKADHKITWPHTAIASAVVLLLDTFTGLVNASPIRAPDIGPIWAGSHDSLSKGSPGVLSGGGRWTRDSTFASANNAQSRSKYSLTTDGIALPNTYTAKIVFDYEADTSLTSLCMVGVMPYSPLTDGYTNGIDCWLSLTPATGMIEAELDLYGDEVPENYVSVMSDSVELSEGQHAFTVSVSPTEIVVKLDGVALITYNDIIPPNNGDIAFYGGAGELYKEPPLKITTVKVFTGVEADDVIDGTDNLAAETGAAPLPNGHLYFSIAGGQMIGTFDGTQADFLEKFNAAFEEAFGSNPGFDSTDPNPPVVGTASAAVSTGNSDIGGITISTTL